MHVVCKTKNDINAWIYSHAIASIKRYIFSKLKAFFKSFPNGQITRITTQVLDHQYELGVEGQGQINQTLINGL